MSLRGVEALAAAFVKANQAPRTFLESVQRFPGPLPPSLAVLVPARAPRRAR